MIGSKPDVDKDFVFERSGRVCAVGYSETDDWYGLTIENGANTDEFKWSVGQSDPAYYCNKFGALAWLRDTMLPKFNEALQQAFGKDVEPIPEKEFDKLLWLTRNKLADANDGIGVKLND